MQYFKEFSSNWQSLLAASIGLASGFILTSYVNNILIPPLMQEFSWTSADIALVGSTVFLAAVCNPIVGRIADLVGVRAVAIFGIIAESLIFVAFSFMSGNFWEYFLLSTALIVLVAATTTQIVYSRLVVDSFDRARGMALAISSGSPPLLWALAIPFLSDFIDHEGWRSGYRLLAVIAATGGLTALLLMPAHHDNKGSRHLRSKEPAVPIFRSRAFRLILLGMTLSSLTMVVQTTQLKVILLNAGLDSTTASLLISAWALGVVAGLLLCGAALDRFAGYQVAAIYMILPGIGLLILASGASTPALLLTAVLFLGLTMGAEGNLAGYLISEYFPLEVFSRAMGAAIGAIAFSGAFGSVLLGLCLKLTGSFRPFLLFAALAAFLASFMLRSLKREPRLESAPLADLA